MDLNHTVYAQLFGFLYIISVDIYPVKVWFNLVVGSIIDKATQGAIHSITEIVHHHSVMAFFLILWKKNTQ